MSTVKTNNLQAVAGGSVVPIADVINGVARAWVNFNGTGVVAIRSSYNVASITDNGVGDYTINFTTPLASALYCPVTGGSLRTTTAVNSDYREHIAGTAQQTVNGFRMHGAATNGSGALVDFEMISVAVFL